MYTKIAIYLILFALAALSVVYVVYQFTRPNEFLKNIYANPLAQGSRYIPKKIFQTVADKNKINWKFRENIQKIRKMNPGWEYTLMDDADILEFIKRNYPQSILDIYNKINPEYGAARADFFRYLLIYKEGGVYLDIKSNMRIPLDMILRPDDQYLLTHWKRRNYSGLLGNTYGEFQQWQVIAAPGHPYLYRVIEEVINNINNYDVQKTGVGKEAVLKVTGPIAYTRAIMPIQHKYPHREVVVHDDIGLIYSVIGDGFTHHVNLFSKPHYSKLKTPVVNK